MLVESFHKKRTLQLGTQDLKASKTYLKALSPNEVPSPARNFGDPGVQRKGRKLCAMCLSLSLSASIGFMANVILISDTTILSSY